MSAKPPKHRPGRSGAPGSHATAGRDRPRAATGARRRRRRGRPDRTRLWRGVLWGGVAVGLAWVAVAMVLFLDDEGDPPPPRPVEVTAGAEGCRPLAFGVEPGESVVLRVTNTTDSDFEVIVTDEAGLALRTSPGYDPDSPEGAGAPGQVETVAAGPGRLGPPLLVAGLLAHEGHEDEAGPNATADFRYRMIVAENGVRIMLVTFPEVGEFNPLTRLVCAAIAADGALDTTMPVGRIEVGSSGR